MNYHGALQLTEALLPLLTPAACIVMVSGGAGELAALPRALRAQLQPPTITSASLRALVAAFQAASERGDLRVRARQRSGGPLWPQGSYAAYAFSKAVLNAATRLLAAKLGPNGARVNAVCPGWVQTEMGGAAAPRSIPEGAQAMVWAATLPPDGPTGRFFRDGRPIPW